MFGVFKKDRPVETKIVDRAVEDKKKALWTLLGGAMATASAGLTLAGPVGYLAMVGVIVVTALRTGVYTDFYCSRRNQDGAGTRFTKAFENIWKKTPLHHLSVWKIENDLHDGTLRAHFKKLDTRANDAENEDRKKTLTQDIKSYTKILELINPNANLLPAAAGGTVLLTSVRNVVRGVIENAPWLVYMTFGMGAAISAAFSFAHLATYTIKKIANDSSNPIFERIGNMVEKTPLRYLSKFLLARQMKKLDKLEISEELKHDLVALSLDKTLHLLSERSGRMPQGMLKTLFNAAAENSGPEKEPQIEAAPAASRADKLELL